MGASINARMGLNTWAAFYGSDADAVVAGDVAMLDARGHAGAEGAARQRHRRRRDPSPHDRHRAEGDLPALLGEGPAQKLATAFRSAIDQTGARPRTTAAQK